MIHIILYEVIAQPIPPLLLCCNVQLIFEDKDTVAEYVVVAELLFLLDTDKWIYDGHLNVCTTR